MSAVRLAREKIIKQILLFVKQVELAELEHQVKVMLEDQVLVVHHGLLEVVVAQEQ